MITMRFRKDWTLLGRVEKKMQGAAEASTNDVAKWIAETMREKVNKPYPPASKGGQPPHRRDGTLRNGITVEDTGRDEAGRVAAGKDTPKRFVRVDTSKAGRGQYGPALEYGVAVGRNPYLPDGLEPRPYFESTLNEAASVYKHSFRGRFNRG